MSAASIHQIDRLPDYFPVTDARCAEPTKLFFTCFEQRSAMKHPKDKESAKNGLAECQSELRGYMTCMESILDRKNKPWWKVW
jgi:hypothetical protein